MKCHPDNSSCRGFTLVEALLAVAVIGVLAAIGIVSMMGIVRSAGNSKDRRNAQSVSALYSSARAAGATFSSLSADKVGVVNELIEGKAGKGLLSTVRFQLPGVSATEVNSLVRFLEFDDNVGLLYQASSDN